MKINAENFIEKVDSFKINNNIFLITGNEPSLISKTINIILESLKSNKFDNKFFDSKKNSSATLKELICSDSLFNTSETIQIINPNSETLEIIEKIESPQKSIIINGENVSNASKIRKFFDSHKKYYSILCYKLSKVFKKKLIERNLKKENCSLSEEAFDFFVSNISDEYQIIENEIIKIANYKNKDISIDEIKRLVSIENTIQFDELFFLCFSSKKNIIINSSINTIRSSSDSYAFLQVVKNFTKILTQTSEKKINQSAESLGRLYLPKYLFKQKHNFEIAIKKTNLDKINRIYKLIQKTELYLRKSDDKFLLVIQRFLLNLSKILK